MNSIIERREATLLASFKNLFMVTCEIFQDVKKKIKVQGYLLTECIN